MEPAPTFDISMQGSPNYYKNITIEFAKYTKVHKLFEYITSLQITFNKDNFITTYSFFYNISLNFRL